jgi:hypothetical protein
MKKFITYNDMQNASEFDIKKIRKMSIFDRMSTGFELNSQTELQ